jgi:DNA invertase Pin-like site-specific DNA recombinase
MRENFNKKQIAYSYARFSSSEQRGGSSLKRQLDMAREWCDERPNIELDESLTDEGISAFEGSHLVSGALGIFLEKCRNGEIPKKSILIVEAFDRLTRMKQSEANKLFWTLLEYVDLVVLRLGDDLITEDRVNEDPTLIYGIITSLNLGHMESKQKSERLKRAWNEKRVKAEQGYLMTEKMPAWLKIEDYDGNSKIDPKTQMIKFRTHRTKAPQVVVSLIEERAKVVKDIFKWYTKGVPLREIQRKLNAQKIETFGGAEYWQKSSIDKILNYHQTYGGYQLGEYRTNEEGSKRERLEVGDVIKNYYPKVISEKVWKSVQQARQTGNFKGARAEKNALASLCVCPKCGCALKRKTYSYKSKPRLICSKHEAGIKCDFKSVVIEDVVESLKVFLAKWENNNAWEAIKIGSDKDKLKLLEINRSLDEAVKQYPSTQISKLIFKLNEEKRKIELRRKHKVVGSEKGFLDAIDTFRTSDIQSEQNFALRKIIEKIIVFEKHDLQVHFKGAKKPIRGNNLVKAKIPKTLRRKPRNIFSGLEKKALKPA